MITKVFVGALLLAIVGSLAFALYFVLSDRPGSNRAVKALSWRIGLSVAAFVILIVAALMGWVEPNTAG
jgi:putative copper export protein